MPDPIILIGMHRSGTSFIARVLQQIGVYMGIDASKAHMESAFFMEMNEMIFTTAHAYWDRPERIRDLLGNQKLSAEVISHLRKQLETSKIYQYLGWLDRLKRGNFYSQNRLWGWKDPKNTYTLPVWLEIFPDAKIIHIIRNGVDVAKSLNQRENNRNWKIGNPLFSTRCLDPKQAFGLWTEYIEMGYQVTKELGETKIFNLVFEEFLDKPQEILKNLSAFVGTPISPLVMNEIISNTQIKKRFSFKAEEEWINYYHDFQNHPLMQRLGYGSLEE